jgi:hypothetical protein
LTNELLVDVALGRIDYLEVTGFSDHGATISGTPSAFCARLHKHSGR